MDSKEVPTGTELPDNWEKLSPEDKIYSAVKRCLLLEGAKTIQFNSKEQTGKDRIIVVTSGKTLMVVRIANSDVNSPDARAGGRRAAEVSFLSGDFMEKREVFGFFANIEGQEVSSIVNVRNFENGRLIWVKSGGVNYNPFPYKKFPKMKPGQVEFLALKLISANYNQAYTKKAVEILKAEGGTIVENPQLQVFPQLPVGK